MSEPLRFEVIDLDYGCHHGRFRVAGKAGPTVIVGSNGSGKSTLVEAIVRTLFGFNRQKPDARRQQEQRRPWKGGRFRAGLMIRDREGSISFERDFDSNEVIVVRPASGEELYRGEANPAAHASGDQRRFRELLSGLIGLVDLAGYERTACIGQGHMLETRLAEDLLKIAAGGHSDIEAARGAVSDRYRELTLAPIGRSERRRRKPGRLEELEADVERLEAELRVVRQAETERAPLVQELRELESDLAESRSDVQRLEEERDALSRLRMLEERADASGERIRRLEGAQQDLREAIWKAQQAGTRIEGLPGRDVYPEDYLERLAALEEGLWPQLQALERRREAGATEDRDGGETAIGAGGLLEIALGAALLGVGGLASGLGWGGSPAPGLIGAIAGLVLIWLGTRRRRERRSGVRDAAVELGRVESDLESLRARVSAKLDGLPDREAVSPATLTERRSLFAEWRSAWDAVEQSERRLGDARKRAERALDGGPRDAAAEGSGASPVERAGEVLTALEDAVSSERSDVLAPTRLAVDRERAAADGLPEDVGASFLKVDERLKSGRAALAAQQDRERELQHRLSALPKPAESSLALDERREALSKRVDEARAEAGAYREAHRLLVDAYEEFRETDQERLVEHVDRHLSALGDGKIGPLSVPDNLESARLMYRGRPLQLASPPLSYGELHTALFGVRLGAADFLAGIGVRLPLLVDDPFVHLDADHAAETWEALRAVARDRQVLVTTQDRLMLQYLGVRADLDLDGSDLPASAQMELPVTGL